MTYGERIRQEREAKGLTQEELAEALGVSRQAVSKWEGDLSRPAAGKLVLLSETLEIPRDAWRTMDAEEAAVQAAAQETAGERKAKRWRKGFAALAVLLCLSLLGNVLLWGKLRPETPEGDDPDLSAAFPETLSVRVSRDYRFGDETPEEDPKDPWELPFLGDDLTRQENTLLSDSLEGGDARCFLSVVKANPRQDQNATFWDIYVLWAAADEAGDLNYRILYRAARDISIPTQVSWQRFEDVLGHDGFRLDIPFGAGGTGSDYLILGEDGVPRVLASLGGTESGAMEYDVDEDGEKEIVCPGGIGVWTVYDRVEGRDWADVYELRTADCGVSTLDFAPEKGGFHAADAETGEESTVLVRYQLRDGEFLRREPTDLTPADYPDAAGTKLQFDLDYFYDSVDLDTVLTTASGLRLTPRQQAYLALQQLFEFTGVKLEEVYCAVSGAGETCFSLWEDGFTDRCFYSADMPEAYGGSGIPSVTFTWQEQGADWSPLSLETLAEARYLPSEPADALWDAYRNLPLMQSGGLANVQADQLWLSDGSLYTADFLETAFGPALTYLTGPYPDGEVRH